MDVDDSGNARVTWDNPLAATREELLKNEKLMAELAARRKGDEEYDQKGKEEEDDETTFAVPEPPARKRGVDDSSVVQSEFTCDYCREGASGAGYYCPHPDGPPHKDLDPHFCCEECVMGFADYEVGEPLCDFIRARVKQRAGRDIVSAAPWTMLLTTGLNKLSISDDGAAPRVVPAGTITRDQFLPICRQGITGQDALLVQKEELRENRKGHKIGQ